MKFHCFTGFWTRKTVGREQQDAATAAAAAASPFWIFDGFAKNEVRLLPPPKTTRSEIVPPPTYRELTVSDLRETCMARDRESAAALNRDLRDAIRTKADHHRNYYRNLQHATGTDEDVGRDGATVATEMARATVPGGDASTSTTEGPSTTHRNSTKQRRQGVVERAALEGESSSSPSTACASVKELRKRYVAMLVKTAANELAPPNSDYCSASSTSDEEKDKPLPKCRGKQKVTRCLSADSAMGHSDEDRSSYYPYNNNNKNNSPRGSLDHTSVPSRTIIEAQTVLFPIDRRKFSADCGSTSDCTGDFDDSRRHSCFTDDGEDAGRYRCWRTPSVVVSDYSDDIVGLTLEDIEYIRNTRKEHNNSSSSPESSLHSSCSNLNYCGSTISGLESEYVLTKPYRKSSNCSTCSTVSGDEETEDAGDDKRPPRRRAESSGWRKLRNIVQWTPFFQTYKKHRYPWVQLAGHQGNFKAGPDQGTILKKLCVKEEKCFQVLMKDVLRPYVPEYKGLVASDDGETEYIQLQDLLGDFVSPCVMDCKIGVRTYLEEELAKAKEKPKLRKDMYDKMCQIDQTAPTDEEHKLKGVTKPRYMVWRETISSTATLGFRIEGVRNSDGTSSKDFKTTKTKEQIIEAFQKFTDGFPHAVPKYIQRLKAIKATLEQSKFFETHEVIGSSLLFVHDRYNANVWLIDFAKTVKLPGDVKITHNAKWKVGNHEDGYLIGVNNLIKIFMTVLENRPASVTPPLSLRDPSQLEQQRPLNSAGKMENT